MPVDFRHRIAICLHRLRNVRKGFAETLQLNSKLKVSEPFDKEAFCHGRIYIAPANYHLMFSPGQSFSLNVDEPVNHSRPSLDIFFETASEIYGERLIGIILSGANSDGAKGLGKIKKAGGLTIVQEPLDCEVGIMPLSCIKMFEPDHIMDAGKIINFIKNL
jgi:two-component system, chemotaxis family, protein-glutamate methylesterase/glutaminase